MLYRSFAFAMLAALAVTTMACTQDTDPPGDETEQSSTTDALRKEPKCQWDCEMDCSSKKCVMVCRGNGPQCNGKAPPGWL